MSRTGQSTLEYLLMLTAVIMAIILAASSTGPFQTGLNNYFSQVQTEISRSLVWPQEAPQAAATTDASQNNTNTGDSQTGGFRLRSGDFGLR